ncbi:MAG: DNA mismatch repair endonuclease MutL [Candidatus Gracilibacteria bacterium]|nr:DNA mismatch repair endonuclease MutL [Candidatus Gracilibacteria bacterium]
MSKIIKLDKNLSNQIAAGEVVERPVSVVKELVENSLDANCDYIKIEITDAGLKSIIVSDNGSGIDKNDLEIATEKYTTSKIKSLEDLYNVMTFGFRGEALASISSVSKLKIISKTAEDNFGNLLIINGGEKEKIISTASENGTKIEVNNLFFNTPARLNYLKTAKTEYSHIQEFLQNITLSYPEIGFEFISDNKEIFKYKKGEDLKTRIYNIYGDEFASNLLKIDFSMSGMKVTGYISSPNVSFQNKNRQVIFVNRRIIKSPIIYKAINDAYLRYIPHSSYPAYVLNLEINPTIIDVNVHPRKQEIRFASESEVFRCFYHAIADNLEKTSLVGVGNQEENNNFVAEDLFSKGNFTENKFNQSNSPKYYTPSGTNFREFSPYKEINLNPNQSQIKESLDFSREILGNFQEENISSNDLHETKLGRVVGQMFNSYIVVETKDKNMLILDQHALAERIIYEKLSKQKNEAKSQRLLIRENINLTAKEKGLIETNKYTFLEIGFDFEFLGGNNLILNSIPDFINKENSKEIFLSIIGDLENGASKIKTLEEVKNKILAYTSCRRAIKFGNKLSIFEMNKLLNDAVLDYSNTCPHGRPVAFEINLEELKKKYER